MFKKRTLTISNRWLAFQTLCYGLSIVSLMLAFDRSIDILWCAIMLVFGVLGWCACLVWTFKEDEGQLQNIKPNELLEEMTKEQYSYIADEVISQVEKATGLKIRGLMKEVEGKDNQ